MESETSEIGAPAAKAERYEPPAVEWDEPFDAVAASDPMDPECPVNPEACRP